MTDLRGVVFDMDGLLLDTEGMSLAGWRRALGEHGCALTEEQYLPMIGRTVADVEALFRDRYFPGLPFQPLYARKIQFVDEIIARDGIALQPGVLEFLGAVETAGLPVAVATSTTRSRALTKLARAGLEGRYAALAGGDEAARGKPAPDLFLLAAQRLGIAPGACLAFEDSDAGARAAHAAGMRLIIVPDWKQPAPDVAALAWRVLPSLCDAVAILESFPSGGSGG